MEDTAAVGGGGGDDIGGGFGGGWIKMRLSTDDLTEAALGKADDAL